jgi:hypothetical protein
MALVLKNRVKVTSTTTGTGAFTLGSAVAGYQDFSVIGDGNETYYVLQMGLTLRSVRVHTPPLEPR